LEELEYKDSIEGVQLNLGLA